MQCCISNRRISKRIVSCFGCISSIAIDVCKPRTVAESFLSNALQRRGQREGRDGRAVLEGVLTDTLNTLLYHNLIELGAVEGTRVVPVCIRNVALHIYRTRAILENRPAQRPYTCRKLGTPKILQAFKCIFCDGINTLGNYQLRQTLTIQEGTVRYDA